MLAGDLRVTVSLLQLPSQKILLLQLPPQKSYLRSQLIILPHYYRQPLLARLIQRVQLHLVSNILSPQPLQLSLN